MGSNTIGAPVAMRSLAQPSAAAKAGCLSGSAIGDYGSGSTLARFSSSNTAPFVCEEELGDHLAVVPGGVEADVTDTGPRFLHETAQLVGIVPHLSANQCDEYVSPYWQGHRGIVVRVSEGRTAARASVRCGSTYSSMSLPAGTDGVAAELVQKSYCHDREGKPKQGQHTVTGIEPGGWYWIKGERNAAVAPLVCADLLGGPRVVRPDGVDHESTDYGTFFQNDEKLMGVVPHLFPEQP